MQSLVDESHGILLAHKQDKSSNTAETMRARVDAIFQCNTEEGTKTKTRDWRTYANFMYGQDIPEVHDVSWPPSQDKWVDFLVHARSVVLSYPRFQGMVGNVCEAANRFWSTQRQVSKASIDPRQLYELVHNRTMRALWRQHGPGVKQVAGVTMHEARNGTHFADTESVRGIATCAAFCIGTGMGGRRPHTLTAIRLKDVTLTCGTVAIHGAELLVPKVCIKFREEKYDDIQGPRHGYDNLDTNDYCDQAWNSAAYWIYKLLVIRGVFDVFDPIMLSSTGDQLPIRPECSEFYLFCEASPNYWIDTAPVSVSTLGNWNKHILTSMGSSARGFSSHRSGFVSRICILAIMHSQGRELPEGTLEVMVRAGGWQAVTGARTVLRVYARAVIDKYIDMYSLSLGYDRTPEQWQAHKAAYLGESCFPEHPIVDCGRSTFPCS